MVNELQPPRSGLLDGGGAICDFEGEVMQPGAALLQKT